MNHRPPQPADRPVLNWVLPLLAIAYLLSRLVLLTRLPVFIDEAILAERASQVLAGEFSWASSAGKWIPSFITALFLLLPTSALFSLRLASALAGLVTLMACVFTNRELFGERDGLLAGFIYTILPYSLFYERLALADVYLSAFAALSLYLSVLLIRSPRWIFRVLLCAACIAAVLSKATGVLSVVIPILAGALLVAGGDRPAYWRRVLPAVALGAAAFVVQLTVARSTEQISAKAINDIASLPSIVLQNLVYVRIWYSAFLTPALALLSSVAVIIWTAASFKKDARAELFLVTVLALSVTPYLIVGRIWFPRYLLFSITPLSMLLARTAGFGASLLPRSSSGRGRLLMTGLTIGCLMALAWPCLLLDWAILNQPESAAIPGAAAGPFITGWSSGYGMPELKQFLEEQAQSGPINVLRFGTSAPTNLSLNLYLASSPRLRLAQVSPYVQDAIAETIAQSTLCRRTLFVSDPLRESKDGIVLPQYLGKAVLVWSYTRPGGETKLQVWETARPSSDPLSTALPPICE